MSNILHKVKEAVTHDHHDKPSQSTNEGPHNSNVANKMDPRVDSDRDGRAAQGYGGATGGQHTGAHSTTAGTGNTYGSSTTTGTGYGTGSTTTGPHSSNLANKADPRIDSTGTSNTYGSGTTTGTGNTFGSSATGAGYGAGSTTGPHSSNLANKVDPRVDSDLDGRGAHGVTGGTYGTTGAAGGATAGSAHNYNTRSGNAGPHDSSLANKADPRIDSDLDNRARHQQLGTSNAPAGSSYATPGTGNTQRTASPHNSNLVNKIDPRVDSNLDGSRTVGGNVTRQ